MTKQYIRVPKGTKIFTLVANERHTYGPRKVVPSIATRDYVVEVGIRDYVFSSHALSTTDDSTKQELAGKVCVHWSSGAKFAVKSDVEIDVPAPVRKAPETKGLTLRQRMIKGSKWRLTAPVIVIKPGCPSMLPNGCVGYSPVTDYELPIGTEIEVAGKFATEINFYNIQGKNQGAYGPNWASFNGLYVPVNIAGQKQVIYVEFKELNKNPEQIGEAPKEMIYAVYDTVQNKYYSSTEYDWTIRARNVVYSDKMSKAKKFKRLADVRSHCLIQSGYYYDLPESWGSIPDWMCVSKHFDIPETWVIHEIDKSTKEVLNTIELVDTFKRSWKLRQLTVRYGSAVRTVYSDLEKKDKLNEYSVVVMFKVNRDGKWYDPDIPADERERINDLVSLYGHDCKIVKTPTGIAIAAKDDTIASMLFLAYQGELKMVVVDFTTMAAKLMESEHV